MSINPYHSATPLNFGAVQEQLVRRPKSWLITGVAGFIGSNLLETLLSLNQQVVGLDNLSTGYKKNLEEVQSAVTGNQWERFRFVEGDICDLSQCVEVCSGVDYVLHQAALGSVPRSLSDPITTNANNISGFLNMLVAARDAKVAKFVYAASSSTYGDHPALPKVEEVIGAPLSPYAVTKYVNELYANVFARSYGLSSAGLRYFNVFGPRQDPNGAYAAVIPKWTASILAGETVFINGDGETSRDFCFVKNAVQANILAAVSEAGPDQSAVYNVAVGQQTTLNSLLQLLSDQITLNGYSVEYKAEHRDTRLGDIRHSLANIGKASSILGYHPSHTVEQGLAIAVPWYIANSQKTAV